MPEGQVLEFTRVTKRFTDVTAVSDLSARVEPGVVTGFLGPNGAGKTTSLKMLLGQVRPTSGTVTVGGKAYSELRHPLRTVGAVLEDTTYRPRRTAMRQLTLTAKANGIAISRVDDVLRLVGLHNDADTRIGGFSLGMRQRLSVATALLGDPGALVLDEPANGLDPEGIRWMRLLMRRLADEGRTVLVSSHVLSEIEQVADHVVVLSRGRTEYAGSIEDLVDPTTGSVVVDTEDRAGLAAALRAAGLSFDVLRSGLTVREADAAQVGAIAASAGIALTTLVQRGPSLEDVFLDLVYGRRSASPRLDEVANPVAHAEQASATSAPEAPSEAVEAADTAAVALGDSALLAGGVATVGGAGVIAAGAADALAGGAVPHDDESAPDAAIDSASESGEPSDADTIATAAESDSPAAEDAEQMPSAADATPSADVSTEQGSPAQDAPAEAAETPTDEPSQEADTETEAYQGDTHGDDREGHVDEGSEHEAHNDEQERQADAPADEGDQHEAEAHEAEAHEGEAHEGHQHEGHQHDGDQHDDGQHDDGQHDDGQRDDGQREPTGDASPHDANSHEADHTSKTATSEDGAQQQAQDSDRDTSGVLPDATEAVSLVPEEQRVSFTELITGLPAELTAPDAEASESDGGSEDDDSDGLSTTTIEIFAPLLGDDEEDDDGSVDDEEQDDPRLAAMRTTLSSAARSFFDGPAPDYPYDNNGENDAEAGEGDRDGEDQNGHGELRRDHRD